MFALQRQENISQKILSGAVALSQESLDDLRRKKILNVPLGQSTSTKQNLGYSYQITQYVCTQKPIIDIDESVTCSTQVSNQDNLRYVLLKIAKNGQKIYTVETVFTKLK